jgi:hypothetical protein
MHGAERAEGITIEAGSLAAWLQHWPEYELWFHFPSEWFRDK